MRSWVSGFSLLVCGTLLAAYGVLQLGYQTIPPALAAGLCAAALGLALGLWAGKLRQNRREALPQVSAVVIPFTPRPR
jgi:hypothetical protein